MTQILPPTSYKRYLFNKKMNQIHIQEIEKQSILTDDAVLSINNAILSMLTIQDLYLGKNQFINHVKQILDLITQDYSIQMKILPKIWNQSFGKLLIDFIESENSVEYLSITLNLIYFLLNDVEAKKFYFEYQLSDLIFKMASSFSTELQLISRCFMVLSNLLPYIDENFQSFLPALFSQISLYCNFEDCELWICQFIHELLQVHDISPFYEPISQFFNKILEKTEFSIQIFLLILKTTTKLQIQTQNHQNEHLNTVIDNIITVISVQIDDSSPYLIYKFLKFIKNSILFSEKQRIYRYLKKLTISSFIKIYEEQENPKITTTVLDIFIELFKIEKNKNFFCQFDFTLNFDEDLLSLIIQKFNEKHFSEKQVVLKLLAELTEFQKIETFNILTNKNKFIFDKLIGFAFNSESYSTAGDCLTFFLNYAEMSLLFENSIVSCPFISNYIEFGVDQAIESLADQDEDLSVSEKAKRLQEFVKQFII